MAGVWNNIGGGSTADPGEVYLMPGALHRLLLSGLGDSPIFWSPALWGSRFRLLPWQFNGDIRVNDVWRRDNGDLEIEFGYSGGDPLDIGPLLRQFDALVGSGASTFNLYVKEYPAGTQPPSSGTDRAPGFGLPYPGGDGEFPSIGLPEIPWGPILVGAGALVIISVVTSGR